MKRSAIIVIFAVFLIGTTMGNPFDINSLLPLLLDGMKGDEGQVDVLGRTIKYKATGRVHSLKEPWVWDGHAWDVKSGVSVKDRHWKSKQGAIEHAVSKLLQTLKSQGIIKEEL